jgi:microsomal dipeptidase-like Zn-dependent dipeptidase
MPLLPWVDNQDPAMIASMIRSVGPERCVLGTDAGVSWSEKGLMNPYPVEGLAALVGTLKKQGFTDAEIQIMARRNPRKLLNLDKN